MFELQLRTVSGAWLNDKTAARTIAVALRDSLAEAIGVQAVELGCDIKQARPQSGTLCQSILVFDRFAAGYASNADRHFGTLFQRVRQRLDCPARCDSVCPRCVLGFDQRFAADSLDRHQALAFLTEEWVASLELPQELRFFGGGSRPEYRRLPESIWQAITRRHHSAVRLYATGENETIDVGASPLRGLAYKLAGRGIKVEVALPNALIESSGEADRYSLASLADHPDVTVRAINGSTPRCGEGWVVAETMSSPICRWGVQGQSAMELGPFWGDGEGPLIVHENHTLPEISGVVLDALSLRPRPTDASDREIEIHHEVDGSIQAFGKRLWSLLGEQHTPLRRLIGDTKASVTSLEYRDRYLFSPLSVALLLRLLAGLRECVDESRWQIPVVNVMTLDRRRNPDYNDRHIVWADWSSTEMRDQVLIATSHLLGLDVAISASTNGKTSHGRSLEIGWSTGQVVTLRLDQGVSYWRASRRNRRSDTYFPINSADVNAQAAQLAELEIEIEGGELPTQLFIKGR